MFVIVLVVVGDMFVVGVVIGLVVVRVPVSVFMFEILDMNVIRIVYVTFLVNGHCFDMATYESCC